MDLSAKAKLAIDALVEEGADPVFGDDAVGELRAALQGYAATDNVRSFGATIPKLRALARALCNQAHNDSASAEKAYKDIVAVPVTKRELAARILRLLDSTFPELDLRNLQSGRQQPRQDVGAAPTASLVLQPGELELVKSFLESRRKRDRAAVDVSDSAGASSTSVSPPRVTFDATGPTVIPSQVPASSTSWSSLLSSAGVSSSLHDNAPSSGLTFWCPLLEHRRGSYTRGPEALAADCSLQVRLVKSWPRPPHPDTVRKANDIRVVLPVLAQAGGVMPSLPLHEDVLRLYQYLLEQCATRSREDAKGRPVSAPRASLGSSTGAFGSLSAVTPVRPGLDSVASARFANAATGQLSDLSSSVHMDQCVHIMEQYTAHKNAPMPKPVVPMSVRVYIQQTMAPADSRVTDAYSVVRGSGTEADARREEVKEIMVQIFEKANEVAFERVYRGTAADREKRRSLGQELSKQQRQISLQRESHALAKLRVLARCIVLGQKAVLTLRDSQSLPQFAQDLIKLQPHLTVAQAISQAKAMLKTETKTGVRVERVAKRPASSPAQRDPAPQRVVIQIQRPDGSRSRASVSSDDKPPRKRKRNSNRRRCYWCQSRNHVISDCPAKKQGLPKTKKDKSQ